MDLLTMYMFNFIHRYFLFSSTGLVIWKMNVPTYELAGSEAKVSGIALCQWGGQTSPNVSPISLYLIMLRISLMVCEFSVIKVCEMHWELPTERNNSTEVYAITAKLTVAMLSKKFVLKLYRKSNSANTFFTHTLFQQGKKDSGVKVPYLFHYANPNRRSSENISSIYIAQKEEIGCLFSSWTLVPLSRFQKGLVSILGFSLASLALTVESDWINDLSSRWLSTLIRKGSL